jgi:hypothetical protein
LISLRSLIKTLLFFLATTVSLRVVYSSPAKATPPEKQRFEFHNDIEAFARALPDSLRENKELISILAALATGYPKEFQGLELGADHRVLVCLADQKFIYDDGVIKTFEQRLDHPDIEDMFHDIYPLTNPTDRVLKDFDPGRYRVEALFRALYGDSESAVAKNCVAVEFCGHTVRFNSRCGAADALRKVSADLAPMLSSKPDLKPYVAKLAGTFNWRKVAGTEHLSNHSFATAIDLNVDKAAYWRWQSPAQLETFSRKSWPSEIIEAFERHGFIWGGKWWHFDTMHFEYRPEIIAYAKSAPPRIPETQTAHP